MNRFAATLVVCLWSWGAKAQDQSDADLSLERANALLQDGQPAQAEEAFSALLEREPGNQAALEGLVWAYMAMGDTQRAALAADNRLALTPDDLGWLDRWALVMSELPERRDEAIAAYQRLVEQRPEDLELRLRLARQLSWSEHRLHEALEVYRAAVELEPESRPAQLGLAQVLSWSGRVTEAAQRYDDLLAENPEDVDALFGRAQLARWAGDLRLADSLLRFAELLAPDDPRLAAERARLELDRDHWTAAYRARDEALRLAPDLYETREAHQVLSRARAPRAGVKLTLSEESTPFWRRQLTAWGELRPLPDTRLRPELTGTVFEDKTGSIRRGSLGLQVRQGGFPQGFAVTGSYRYHRLQGGGRTHEPAGELALRPAEGPLLLRAGARRRAMVDLPPGYEDIAYLEGVGSGGTDVDGVRDRLQVGEGYLAAVVNPLAGTYAYAELLLGRVCDGNGRRSAAAGLGADMLAMTERTDLVLKYDFYGLAYTRWSPDYFSPRPFLVHTPGVDLRFRFGGWATLGGEVGLPIEPGEHVGYRLGAFFRLEPLQRLMVEGRVQVMDDTRFRQSAGTLGALLVF